jgi:hypothetical protein
VALVFTDARGHVVWVDNGFLSLMAYPEAVGLVGLPVHRVLGIDPQDAAEMLQDVARSGHIHERPMVLHSADGESISVLCSGVATRNPDGEFIGADIALFDAASTSVDGVAARDHSDVLQTRIDQIQAESELGKASKEQVLLQLYFTAQINMLSVLATRLGGPRIHAVLESLVNKMAAREGWAVRLHGGQITLDERGLPAEGYASLLKEIASYASDLIGRSPVLEEMRAVDARVGENARQSADQAGLRGLIQ